MAFALPHQLRVGIGGRLMRRIRPALPMEIHRGIARIPVVPRPPTSPPALEALLARPRLHQGPVDGEVLRREQSSLLGLGQHRAQEGLGNVALQQPLAVLGKHRHVPHRLIQLQAHEPPVEHVIVELLHQLPLTADGIQRLEQQGPQQLLGRNRRPAALGIQPIKPARQRPQRPVGHLTDGAQGMVRRHPLLGRDVAEQLRLRSICSAHRPAHRKG